MNTYSIVTSPAVRSHIDGTPLSWSACCYRNGQLLTQATGRTVAHAVADVVARARAARHLHY